jgi:hypothetical protein
MTDRQRYVERIFEIPVVVAALLVIPVVVVEATSSIGKPWTTIAAVVNWAIWSVFAAELVSYLVVVRDRWRWLREHPLEVIIVVLRHFCRQAFKRSGHSDCSGSSDSFGWRRWRDASSRCKDFDTSRCSLF